MTALCASTEFGIAGAWLAEYTLQTVDAGVLFFDNTGQIVQWNATAARLLGVTEEQLAGRRIDDPWWAATNAEGRRLTEADNPVRRTLDTGEQVTGGIFAIRYPDGTEMWLSITALPVFGPDRRVRGALASIVSVAGGTRVTEILAAAVHCGRAAFEHSLTAHVLVDRAGRISDWNRAMCELIDRSDVELVGGTFDLICDFDLERVWADQTDVPRIDTHIEHGDGSRIPVVAKFTAVEWPGTGKAIMAQFMDGRFQRSSTLPADRRQDISGYSNVKVAMLTTTAEGVIVEMNDAACDLFGLRRAELANQPIDGYLSCLPADEDPRTLSDEVLTSAPVSIGLCCVSSSVGADALKELFVSRLDSARSVLLLQLADVNLDSLAEIANRVNPSSSSCPQQLAEQRLRAHATLITELQRRSG